MSLATEPGASVGDLLRDWRQRRRLSQLDLAVEADVSARHLSFVETGRSKPSRELLLHLAEHLEVPLRERNALLLAAGYAPGLPGDAARRRRRWRRSATPSTRSSRGHEPFPAVDRRPPLGPGLGQPPGPGPAHRRRGARAARAAGQRACGSASTPTAWRPASPTWPSRAPTCSPAAPPGRRSSGDPRAGRAARRAARLPGRRARRRRRAVDAAPTALRAAACCDADGVELRFFSTLATFGTAARHHPRRAGHRVVLPGRRGDRGRPALRRWGPWTPRACTPTRIRGAAARWCSTWGRPRTSRGGRRAPLHARSPRPRPCRGGRARPSTSTTSPAQSGSTRPSCAACGSPLACRWRARPGGVTPGMAEALRLFVGMAMMLGEQAVLALARVVGAVHRPHGRGGVRRLPGGVELPQLSAGIPYPDVVRGLHRVHARGPPAVLRRPGRRLPAPPRHRLPPALGGRRGRARPSPASAPSASPTWSGRPRSCSARLGRPTGRAGRRVRGADVGRGHRRGGRVVKLIGDEAMFVFEDPAAACAAALDLAEPPRIIRCESAWPTARSSASTATTTAPP